MQIIGNFFDEPRVIQAAHAFEQAFGWANRLPSLW
jgi:Asp-tRNA(Asn)/Glu-tRNA(Gln) amidotransferase A subunit family amidase